MLKKTLLVVSFLSMAALLTSFTPVKKYQTIKTIIIDAGHGIMSNGQYNGAKGTYSFEDEITLAISKKLVAIISQEFPDIKIVETRPTKYITSLHERANIANRNRGDLFISIHVNALSPIQHKELVGYKTEVYYSGKGKKKRKHTKKVPQYHFWETANTSGKGTQTYIWGAHKAEDKEIAVRENSSMLTEDNYQENYGSIDVNSPDFFAMSIAKTQRFTIRSATLAGMVEDEFAKVGRISGGKHQRQVGIWVLQATAMPSILVETGFITNPDEERYLNSDTGQEETAQCVANALKNYMGWLEKKQVPVNNNSEKNTQTFFLNAIEQKEKKLTSR